MSRRLPGRMERVVSSPSAGRAATERTGMSRMGASAGVGAEAGADVAGAVAACSADWKKADREDWAGDDGVCDGNRGDGTGGRIALMPTGLMKTV